MFNPALKIVIVNTGLPPPHLVTEPAIVLSGSPVC